MADQKERIIFLDLLRAIAVILMIEGHTFHALLSEELRSFEYPAYSVWNYIRGFTAPIFMFTAGTVFAYLLYRSTLNGLKINLSNPRVKKGLKRAGILLVIGYLLRFPTFNPFGWFNVSESQWRIFSSVDALHVIAVGLFLVIIFSLLIYRFKVNAYPVYLASALFFFVLTPFSRQIEWINFLPRALASYFTKDYGSIFPVFPWAGYLLAGSAYGYYLFNVNPANKMKIAVKTGIIGFVLLIISFSSNLLSPALSGTAGSLRFSYSIYTLRVGAVLLLASFLIVTTFRIKSLPRIVQLLGKHSLVIYAVHLMIIYGSALSPGLSWYYGKIFSLPETILIFLLITILMLLLAWSIEWYKKHSLNISKTIIVYFKRFYAGVK